MYTFSGLGEISIDNTTHKVRPFILHRYINIHVWDNIDNLLSRFVIFGFIIVLTYSCYVIK